MVDNTFATPYCCRPIEHGVRISWCIRRPNLSAGMGQLDWRGDRRRRAFPLGQRQVFAHDVEPLSMAITACAFARRSAIFAFVMKTRCETVRDTGSCISPFNAFLLLQGLETLSLRMERHCQNAQRVAEFLLEHPAVSWVHYPGLPGDPSYDLAKRYLPRGAGAIFTFGLKGGYEAGKQVINRVRLFSHLANVGDARSLIIHPASTTHQQLTDEELAACGIGPDMIRLSIGIEDIDEHPRDLGQALEKSQEASPITEAPAMVAVHEFEPSGHSLLSKAFGAPYQR